LRGLEWGEHCGVDPAGDHSDIFLRYPHPFELSNFVGTSCDDQVRLSGDGSFGSDPIGWAGVLSALVSSFDGAQCVKCLHDRDVYCAGRLEGGQTRHPKVGMHDIRSTL
jgi:hypothetical protein